MREDDHNAGRSCLYYKAGFAVINSTRGLLGRLKTVLAALVSGLMK